MTYSLNVSTRVIPGMVRARCARAPRRMENLGGVGERAGSIRRHYCLECEGRERVSDYTHIELYEEKTSKTPLLDCKRFYLRFSHRGKRKTICVCSSVECRRLFWEEGAGMLASFPCCREQGATMFLGRGMYTDKQNCPDLNSLDENYI